MTRRAADRKVVIVREVSNHLQVLTRWEGPLVIISPEENGTYSTDVVYPRRYAVYSPSQLFDIEQMFRTAQELGEAIHTPERLRRLLKLYG